MAETTEPFDLYGTRYTHDPNRAERSARGAALCRATLTATDDTEPIDPTNPIRDRALRRARAERQARRRPVTPQDVTAESERNRP